MRDKRPSLSLTPAAEAFVADAPEEAPRQGRGGEEPRQSRPKRQVKKAAEKKALPPESSVPTRVEGLLPPRHRVLSSGELKRRVTGFVKPELGKRLDDYLESEERTVSWVMQRALTMWLDANA